MITDKMKTIDSDLKKLMDDMNEKKGLLNQVSKKEGTSFLTKDLGEVIYGSKNIKAEDFVEKLNSTSLSTVIAVINKMKV